MNGHKHIINRQVLELTVPGRDRVHVIQNKTSEIVKQKLKPELDALFSKLASADEIIRIDKMVIDLGTISENELETVFVERIIKEIGDKINRLNISRSSITGKSPVNGHHIESGEKFTATSKSKDLLEQFIFFLQNGHFPWWHKSSVKNNLDEIFVEVLKYDITVLKNAIIPLFRNPSIRKRLIYQFNHSQLYALFEKINYPLIKSYFASFLVLLSLIKTSQKRKEITGQFYETALLYFSTEQELINEELKIGFVKDILRVRLAKHSVADKETVLAEIIHQLLLRPTVETPNDANLTLVALIQVALELPLQNQSLTEVIQNIPVKKGTVIYYLVEQYIKKIEKESVRKKTGKNALTKKTAEIEFGNESEINSDESVHGKVESRGKSLFLLSPKSETGSDGIVVSNAGLVLIHPFLRYFFEGLNLLDQVHRFKSQSDAFKAIHLLQFIATGEENVSEIDLPLNKILCGLDITEPIPMNVMLLEEEKKECIYLIKTVLERWGALKTSNPEALRETYLKRQGILKQEGQSWNLTVERSTFDVMLEKLPWSINLIKLPWLSQILYVEW